ncbi:histidine kinase [Sphingomonas sp. ID0503]|uniref:histidine kinase n=1 Tax=Sphingomonas sp. ID0503 TaxID=3399691 RepID=UPI003AFAF104
MWRFAAGAVAALMLVTGVFFLWKSGLSAADAIPAAPAAIVGESGELPAPPEADAKSREERRFGRYDKDEDGKVTSEEYLASRRKAFAKLDVNGDGRLTFEEWAIKTTAKFAKADGDKNGALVPEEFATTKVERKSAPRCACPEKGSEE